MTLTDVELEMLIKAFKGVTFNDGLKPSPDYIRLERKFKWWRDHPDLEFV